MACRTAEPPAFERYRADPDSAREFVARCRRREMDDRLIVKPGKNRGTAI